MKRHPYNAAWGFLFLTPLAIAVNSCARSQQPLTAHEFRLKQSGVQAVPEKAAAPEYLIGPGDELKITVLRHPELTLTTPVTFSGLITFPLVGDIPVSGKTVFQIRDFIRDELAGGYVPNPQVIVSVANFANPKVFVLGEVRNPGVLFLKTQMDAIEAISLAGGFLVDGNPRAVLLIRNGQDKTPALAALDLQQFLRSGDATQNVVLQKGDILYVPPSRIANVSRFFAHLSTILAPFAPNLMNSIILYPRVLDALEGKRAPVQIE